MDAMEMVERSYCDNGSKEIHVDLRIFKEVQKDLNSLGPKRSKKILEVYEDLMRST